MRFVLSFSGGKNCILALHRMVRAGHEPVALLVMYCSEQERSWTHGLTREMLDAASDSLGIPLLCCDAKAERYEKDMERCLQKAKKLGASACVFGDIGNESHRKWNEARCCAVGMQAIMPLWNCTGQTIVRELIRLDYCCIIKCLRKTLPEKLLGRELSEALVSELVLYGADLCGGYGDYHTFVVDGPIFHHPLEVVNYETVHLEHITAADLRLAENRITLTAS